MVSSTLGAIDPVTGISVDRMDTSAGFEERWADCFRMMDTEVWSQKHLSVSTSPSICDNEARIIHRSTVVKRISILFVSDSAGISNPLFVGSNPTAAY